MPPAADTAFGAFTDDGPWVLDLDAIAWKRGLARLRDDVRARLPELTRPRRVPPGLRVVTTVRHLGGAVGVWAAKERRLGGSIKIAGISRRLRSPPSASARPTSSSARSSRRGEGIFPEELVAEFKKCRDQVPPEPWAVVRARRRGGARPAARARCSPRSTATPLAAASIAQVHAATLLDGEPTSWSRCSGRRSPSRVHQDLAVMAWLAPFLVGRIPVAALANPPALVELFAETITEELDFRLEAENMLDVARVVRRARPARLRRPPPAPRRSSPAGCW